MLTRLHDPVQLFRHKMEGVAELSASERNALTALPVRVVSLGADQDIVRQADRNMQCCLLMQGLACSSKLTGEGRRQIVAFHLPGDIPDLLSLHVGTVDTTVTTMTAARVGVILHEHLRELFANRHLATALWRSLVTEAAIAREWAVNLGQRRGPARTAHLLSELITRMHAIGAIEGDSFDLPITQQELADALGLSTVHVNRSLQALRGQGLISWVGKIMSVLDREALAEAGDFDEGYLHLGAARA
jgi:CRP-like cAMP-binding protein